MYHESIGVHKLRQNRILVKFSFELQEDVQVQCNELFRCTNTKINCLPSVLFNLIFHTKAATFRLVTRSGLWDGYHWDYAEGQTISMMPGGTILLASAPQKANTKQFEHLRTSLASILGLPIGPTFSDTANNGHANLVGFTGNSSQQEWISQHFPLVEANPDTWQRWSHRLLPCRGKAGIGKLLNASTLRASLWHSISLNLQVVHPTNDANVQDSSTDSHNSSIDSGVSCLWEEGIDETKAGAYRVKMSVQVDMVLPPSSSKATGSSISSSPPASTSATTSTLTSASMRHTTSLGHTKEEQYPTVDLIAAIKNATYSTSTGDANSSRESSRNSGGRGDGSMCRIPGATAPRVRYFYPSEHLVHNSSLSSGRVSAEDRDQLLLFKEVSYGDLAALMSVAVSNEDVPELSPSFMARTQQLDEFWRYVEADNYVSPSGRRDSVSLNRKLFDSRALELTVQTTIHSHVTEHQRAMLTFNEVLPEHYDIDLQSYTYRVLLHPDRVEKEGFVADLPNFRWTSHDCVVHYSNISTAYNMQYIMNNMQQPTSVPEGSTCSRTYMFEVPFLPSGGLFSTVYQANKRFVRREMQPVDASRGALVPPSLLTICSTNANASTGDLNDRRDTFQYSLTDINGCRVLYTDNFLITAPIPDASMPYNVITLVSTLLAFFMGSFINALLKKPKTATSSAGADVAAKK